jgi:hypothetical protein
MIVNIEQSLSLGLPVIEKRIIQVKIDEFRIHEIGTAVNLYIQFANPENTPNIDLIKTRSGQLIIK